MKPGNEDGIFIGKDPILYNVSLENTYDISQTGTIAYSVKDAITGDVMSEKVYDLKMPRHSSRNIQFKLAPPPKPGMYNLELAINTNTYDDTTRHSFGYEIAQITNPYHKPDDFDNFWKEALEELAAVSPEYSVEEDPSQSTDEVTVYRVEMNSLENIRIYGWLTIPKVVIRGKNILSLLVMWVIRLKRSLCSRATLFNYPSTCAERMWRTWRMLIRINTTYLR